MVITVPIELRDILTAAAILGTFVSVYLVNRNAKRSWALQQKQAQAASENTDLTRIRDLRSEVTEANARITSLNARITEMEQHLTDANRRAMVYAQREAEMFRYARMPGVTMDDWLDRFDNGGSVTSIRAR